MIETIRKLIAQKTMLGNSNLTPTLPVRAYHKPNYDIQL